VDQQTRAQAPMARARIQRVRGRLLHQLGRFRETLAALDETDGMRRRAGFSWPLLQLDLLRAKAAAGQPVPASAFAELRAAFRPEDRVAIAQVDALSSAASAPGVDSRRGTE
jgi:hypothetical protein